MADWTFPRFFFYLLLPIIASMLGLLLIPRPHPDTDLEKEFYCNRLWFFGLLTAMSVVSLLEDLFRSHLTLDLQLGIRVAILVSAGTGFAVGSKRAQLPIAVAVLFLALAHIGIGFWRL